MMGGPMENTQTSAPVQAPCRYIRCKEMYYDASDTDEYASGAYWCTLTQESFGPDSKPCDKKQCCEGRACYLP